MRTFTQNEKKFVGTTALIIFCLIFFAFFEQTEELSSIIQGFIIAFIFFFCLPLAYCRYVLREPLASLGIQGTLNIKDFLWALLLAFVGFMAIWALQWQFPALAKETLFPVIVEESFLWFVIYALTAIPLTVAVYEVFFRGLIQILWLRNTWIAVLTQFLLFSGLLLLSDGADLTDVPLIITALLAGIVAKKTGSLWYSLGTGILILFFTDVLFLSLR
jgi:hypothetical protein